ncbi:MAG: toll/interleukin-1 receptor domain-containing protein [Eggerthellaceae bacterium]|nr:toll/interleukin-1 receptor domain-containing protein [Eggerthellaceae bacterium]
MAEPTYAAFISYRHKPLDTAVAKAIHRQIETYRIPSHIAKKLGKKHLGKVFRDQDELPLTDDLGEGIRQALRNSEWLIVVCSPDTPLSKWCMAEIDYFIELGRRNKILTVLASGEPDDSFPLQLRFKEADGKVVESEPLAADVRAHNDAASVRKVRTEKLRLLAPMLGVGYDNLKRRQRQRLQRRVAGASICVAALSLAGGAYVVNQNAIVRAERETALISQSQFLSAASAEKLAAGDPATAALLALEALPQNLKKPERPLVDEAVVALRNARASQIQGEYTLTGGVSQAFFPDWQYLEKDRVLTYFDNDSQYYYHLLTGQLIGQTNGVLEAHSPEHSLIAVSEEIPNPDQTKRLTLYSLNDFSKPLLEIYGQDTRSHFSFAAEGRSLFYCLTRVSVDENYVGLLDVESGESLFHLTVHDLFPDVKPKELSQPYLASAAISPDGKRIAVGIGRAPEGAPVVELYDTSSRAKTTLLEHQTTNGEDIWWLEKGVYRLEFSPNGLQLRVIDNKGEVHLFDTISGEHIVSIPFKKGGESIQGHEVGRVHADFSPDSTHLAVWMPGGNLEVYCLDTQERVAQADPLLGTIDYAGFTADNTLIYLHVSSSELFVLPLDALDSQYTVNIPDLLFDQVRGLSVHADGFTAVSRRGTYQLWEHSPSLLPISSESGANTAAPAFDIVRFSDPALSRDTARVFSPDGTQFAVSNNSIISIYDTESLERLVVVEQETAEPWVSVFIQSNELPRTQQLLWLPDGKRLLSTSVIGGARVIDATTGTVLHSWESEYTSSPFATLAAVSPDGRFFALNNPSYLGGMYDLDTYEKLYDFPGEFTDNNNNGAMSYVDGCCFSPDSSRFYMGSPDTLVAIDPRTGTRLMELPYKPTYGMAISPDGTKLAFGGSASEGGLVDDFFIIDTETGNELWYTNVEVGIRGIIAWSSDGSLVAASDTNDNRTTLWDSTTGDVIGVFDGYDPQFSADSRLLLLNGFPALGKGPQRTDLSCVLYNIQSKRPYVSLPAIGVLSPVDGGVLMQNAMWYEKPLETLMAEARMQLAGRELTDAERQQFSLE